MQMLNASSCCSSIVVANVVCIGLFPQEIQRQDRLNMVLGPVFEILPAEHFQIKILQVRGFNSGFDSTNSIEIVCLFCFNQIENRYHMPLWNNQGVPGIYRVSVEDSHKRPVFKDKGVGLAP